MHMNARPIAIGAAAYPVRFTPPHGLADVSREARHESTTTKMILRRHLFRMTRTSQIQRPNSMFPFKINSFTQTSLAYAAEVTQKNDGSPRHGYVRPRGVALVRTTESFR